MTNCTKYIVAWRWRRAPDLAPEWGARSYTKEADAREDFKYITLKRAKYVVLSFGFGSVLAEKGRA